MFSKRRIHKTFLYIFLITVTFIGTTLFRKQRTYIQYDINNSIDSEKLVSSVFSTTVTMSDNKKRVTKSFSEMFAQIPELSDHVVFFNRVPKAGSEMLVLLMQWMQGINGFKHVRLPGSNTRRLTRLQQEELVEKVTSILHDETIPLSFDRHVYFINFTSFGRQSPTYINLVRDPVDKAISSVCNWLHTLRRGTTPRNASDVKKFYYGRATQNPLNPDLKVAPGVIKSRFTAIHDFEECVAIADPECNFQTGKLYDLAIPYFCGHNKRCMVLNDRWALQMAKANVDRYYPVVGVLEELNATLAVLEKKLPYFFKGVQVMYHKQLLQPHRNKNGQRPRDISDNVRKKLKSSLRLEYEFYYWLHRRLIKQFTLLGQ